MLGEVSVQWISGAWAIIKEDDTTLPVGGSVANILNTAIAYSTDGGWPLFLRSSIGRPFVIENSSLVYPGVLGSFVNAEGCCFVFNNTTQPGHLFDTAAYGAHLFKGGTTRYTGTGPVMRLRPTASYVSGGRETAWTRQHYFETGVLCAEGGNPRALLQIDPSGRLDPDFYFTSNIADIVIRTAGEGYGRADYGIEVISPAADSQVAAEILVEVMHIESCRVAEIQIGSGGAHDNGLGSWVWLGNVGGGGQPHCLIDTNAPWHQFYMQALNYNAPGGPYNVRFRSNARGNVINSKQMIPGYAGTVLDENATPSDPNQVNVSSYPAPAPTLMTSGAPTQHASAGPYTYVDRSWSIPNGTTVTKLWDRCDVAGSLPSKILRRNSPGNYDVVVDVINNHPGGDVFSPVNLTPYTIPNDGKEYFRGVYVTGSQPRAMVDPKLRSWTSANVTGNNVTITEDGGVVGQPVAYVGVTN